METTIRDQMSAIRACAREAQNQTQYRRLNDAYSTLAGLNMIVGNPVGFKNDLHQAIKAHLKVEYHGLLEEAVLKFLKARGLPI